MSVKKVIFQCELATPLFSYGANTGIPELRVPAIKGILRFWWRAINAHLSINELRQNEMVIFGGNDEKVGKSKVSIKASHNIKTSENDLLRYLPEKYKSSIGYVLYSVAIHPKKPYIKQGTTFDLQFISKDDNSLQQFINSLLALEYFGGIGARNRRGAGSIAIKEINGDIDRIDNISLFDMSNIKDKKDLIRRYKEISKLVKDEKQDNYSILKGSHVIVCDPKSTWEEALSIIANQFRMFRKEKEGEVTDAPNFGFPIRHKNGSIFLGRLINKDKNLPRRSSPIILKVLKVNNHAFFPIIIYLGGEFLPENSIICDKNNTKQAKVSNKIIYEFLDRFKKTVDSEEIITWKWKL